jgi:hypothetical protein
MREDRSLSKRLCPPLLEGSLRFVPHATGDVTVDAAHAGDLMAHPFDFSTSAMRSSSIHVRWPCLRPCVVRPGNTGNHEASATSSAGCWAEPGH